MSVVIVFAYDPVEELGGRVGVIVADAEVAERLVAEHLVELAEAHCSDALRFVAGSTAYAAARDELRAARNRIGVRKARTPKAGH